MKSSLFCFILGAGIFTIAVPCFADPAFTTKDPVGRVLTTKSEDQYLSYYCLERTDGVNNEFKGNPKCISSQYAVSTKSGSINVDGFGNATRESGGWSPIGPIFDEASIKSFQNRMRSMHPEAYDEVWGGLFKYDTGWQNEALQIPKWAMKEFIEQLVDLRDGPTENWATDAAQYASAGRVIANKSTGETLDLACLEVPVAGVPCRHFQVRYSHRGTAELVGSELIIKAFKERAKDLAKNANDDAFESRKPTYNSGMPFLMAALKNGYGSDGASSYFGYPAFGTFMIWGTAAAISGIAILPALAIGVGIVSILPIADITVAASRNLTKAARRFVITSQEHHSAKKLSQDIDKLFEGADVGKKSIRVKNESFQILKQAVTGANIESK